MITYDLKVGYSCNNKCKHCVIDDSKDKLIESNKKIDLTTEECLELIDIEVKKGIDSIVLTGGEVTIRKDFNKLIQKCTSNNLDITIQTNGRNFINNDIIEIIREVNNIRFIVALHGANDVTHDYITQVNGSFFETCEGIKKIINLNKLVILKVVISKINALELKNIVKLAKKLGIKFICFAFPHGQGGARKNFGEVIPKYSDLKPLLEETILEANQQNIQIEFEAIPYCIIPKHMKLVGELKYLSGNAICTQVNEQTFNWHDIRKSIKGKGRNCEKCSLNNLCEGPWIEYIEAFGSDELIPIVLTNEQKKILEKAISLYKGKK